jgi:hypothetical protein
MDSAVNNLTIRKGDGEADSAATLDVNTDTSDPCRARGWLERNKVIATGSEVDRACRIDYPMFEWSRPGVRGDEKATEQKERLISVS